jgi:hypothetical protein
MDTTIGTAQTSQAFTNTAIASNNKKYYVTKFVSQPINQSGIAANTWTYNFAVKTTVNASTDDYPCIDTSQLVPVTCYVWRPSTGAKVGNIVDGNTASTYFDVGNQNTTGHTLNEVAEHGTFTGAAVAGAAASDVIIMEAWVNVWMSTAASTVLSWFYDGTTTNTTSGTVVSNHASFLETPETITFAGGGGSIAMTNVSTLDFSNHLITKV